MNYRGDPLARYLASAGDSVHVVSPAPTDNSTIDDVIFSYVSPYRSFSGLGSLVQRCRAAVATFRVTRAALRNEEFDCVRTISTWPTVIALLARGRKRHVRVIANLSDFYGDLYAGSQLPFDRIAQMLIAKLEKYAAKADYFIVDTATQRKQWGMRGVPHNRCVVLPHGLPRSMQVESSEDTTLDVRQDAQIQPDEKLLAYVGDISEMDGLDLVLQAVSLIEQRVRLVIVGKGTEQYMTTLKSKASRIGVESQITWIDRIPNSQLPQLFAQADACLAPFRLRNTSATAIPNKILEYMTSHAMIVMAKDTPVEQLIGAAGIEYFKADDAIDLQRAIESAIATPIDKRPEELARRQMFWKTLDWHNICEHERDVIVKGSTSTDVDFPELDFSFSTSSV